MDESEIPIYIQTSKLKEWLISRRIVSKNSQPYIKAIRNKISNAIKDMPSNEQLIALLSGAYINYYHCKEIVDILKQTEKDTKSVFGTYGSQRMKDWQEIIRLYEKDNVYLVETAQIYVRNVTYDIPGLKKQISKMDQQSEECLKRIQDLAKPEAQLQAEHTELLQKLGVKGENLREEFISVLGKLPDIYKFSIRNIGSVQEAVSLYGEYSANSMCLPIIKHLIEFGNTTVYQYIHREAPISIEENEIKLCLTVGIVPSEAAAEEIDFGDDNGGTSSSISAEIVDFGDFVLDNNTPADETNDGIDWGTGNAPSNDIQINFDIPIEEYGIVVEGVGMDGGKAKGEQAYTILDSPNYRDRFTDELYELEAFLKMRLIELEQLDSVNNFMLSMMENTSTHDKESIRKMINSVISIVNEISSESTRHLFQLKHSPKYADLLASKLKQMKNAVDKINHTKEVLKTRSIELKIKRQDLPPLLEDQIRQAKSLHVNIEKDISKRYKNRDVILMGGINEQQ